MNIILNFYYLYPLPNLPPRGKAKEDFRPWGKRRRSRLEEKAKE
jgi:hypothetical protein